MLTSKITCYCNWCVFWRKIIILISVLFLLWYKTLISLDIKKITVYLIIFWGTCLFQFLFRRQGQRPKHDTFVLLKSNILYYISWKQCIPFLPIPSFFVKKYLWCCTDDCYQCANPTLSFHTVSMFFIEFLYIRVSDCWIIQIANCTTKLQYNFTNIYSINKSKPTFTIGFRPNKLLLQYIQ